MQGVFALARKAGFYDPQRSRVEHVGFGVVLGEDRWEITPHLISNFFQWRLSRILSFLFFHHFLFLTYCCQPRFSSTFFFFCHPVILQLSFNFLSKTLNCCREHNFYCRFNEIFWRFLLAAFISFPVHCCRAKFQQFECVPSALPIPATLLSHPLFPFKSRTRLISADVIAAEMTVATTWLLLLLFFFDEMTNLKIYFSNIFSFELPHSLDVIHVNEVLRA